MKNASLLDELAGDPEMAEVRAHAGWKPVLATLLALVICVTAFFNVPEPAPAQVAVHTAAEAQSLAP